MKTGWQNIRSRLPKHASMAHGTGITAILLSLLVGPFSPMLAVIVLLVFVVLCFTAPFLPWFSFFLPIVSRGEPSKHAVAITFDDGPDPASTPELLQLLAEHKASATFYVTGRRAEQYPELIKKIVSMGHTIGNHSYSHDNFIMLKSTAALKEEIAKTQRVLHNLCVFPLTFRPPVGVTSPKLFRVLQQLNMYAVNFRRRAGDMGNRKILHLSKKILKKLRSGDIIMLHDIPLRNAKMKQHWLDEVGRILAGIKDKKWGVLPLADLIDRSTMEDPQTNCSLKREKSN